MTAILTQIWAWISAHQTTCTLGAYYVMSAFVGSLGMPDNQSGAFYRFFFKFVNALAANFSRAQASTTSAGYQVPKPDSIPGPQIPAPPKDPPKP